MTKYEATYTKKCLHCGQPTKVKNVSSSFSSFLNLFIEDKKKKILTVTTKCEKCDVEYTDTFER